MTCEEIARRKEWNRIVAWLKPPQSCPQTMLQRRAVNQRTFSLLRALRQKQQVSPHIGPEQLSYDFRNTIIQGV